LGRSPKVFSLFEETIMKILFWLSLLGGAFLIDAYGPWWLRAVSVVSALGWFVLDAWWQAQKARY
jgi:hypothetical protein